MNIVFLTRRFAPDMGGVETHVLQISKILVSQGHIVTVITQSQGAPIVDGVTVIRLPLYPDGKEQKFHVWEWMLEHIHLFFNADVVHCHDVFFWYLPLRFLLPWKPVYTTFHGYETVFPPEKKAVRLRRVYEYLSWANICVGKYLEKWYGTKADMLMYGGVTPEQVYPMKKHTGLHIGFVGRLTEDTGLPVYLEALSLMKKKKIACTFDAFGDGPLKKETQKYGEAHGFVSDVQKKIADCDIVFAASFQSVLDAFAQKKYVIIVTQNQLKKDTFSTTPYAKDITLAENAQDILTAVMTYQKDPSAYAEKIEKNYQFAQKNSWEEIVKRYHQLWQK